MTTRPQKRKYGEDTSNPLEFEEALNHAIEILQNEGDSPDERDSILCKEINLLTESLQNELRIRVKDEPCVYENALMLMISAMKQIKKHKRPILDDPESTLDDTSPAPSTSASTFSQQKEKDMPVIIPIENIKIIRQPKRSGMYGEVEKAIWNRIKNEQINCAIKSYKVLDGEKFYYQEISILQQLDHIFIVKIFGVVIPRYDYIKLVMELCDYSLEERLAKKEPLKIDQKLNILIQVATGLDYLIAVKCYHYDIAERNILLCNVDKLAKIADFGIATRSYGNSKTKQRKEFHTNEMFNQFYDIFYQMFKLEFNEFKGTKRNLNNPILRQLNKKEVQKDFSTIKSVHKSFVAMKIFNDENFFDAANELNQLRSNLKRINPEFKIICHAHTFVIKIDGITILAYSIEGSHIDKKFITQIDLLCYNEFVGLNKETNQDSPIEYFNDLNILDSRIKYFQNIYREFPKIHFLIEHNDWMPDDWIFKDMPQEQVHYIDYNSSETINVLKIPFTILSSFESGWIIQGPSKILGIFYGHYSMFTNEYMEKYIKELNIFYDFTIIVIQHSPLNGQIYPLPEVAKSILKYSRTTIFLYKADKIDDYKKELDRILIKENINCYYTMIKFDHDCIYNVTNDGVYEDDKECFPITNPIKSNKKA